MIIGAICEGKVRESAEEVLCSSKSEIKKAGKSPPPCHLNFDF